MKEQNKSSRGGTREGCGRKRIEGTRHMYKVADDVHEWIIRHGGGQYLNDTIRVIIATQNQ